MFDIYLKKLADLATASGERISVGDYFTAIRLELQILAIVFGTIAVFVLVFGGAAKLSWHVYTNMMRRIFRSKQELWYMCVYGEMNKIANRILDNESCSPSERASAMETLSRYRDKHNIKEFVEIDKDVVLKNERFMESTYKIVAYAYLSICVLIGVLLLAPIVVSCVFSNMSVTAEQVSPTMLFCYLLSLVITVISYFLLWVGKGIDFWDKLTPELSSLRSLCYDVNNKK